MGEAEELDVQYKFVGRKDFLNNLKAQWSRYRIFGIFGLKSVGKSRTIDEFLKGTFSANVKIINVELRSTRTLDGFMLQLTSAFQDDYMSDDTNKFVDDILQKMEELLDLNFILNFDNAEDILESSVKEQFVSMCETLIEKCTRVKIIITSTVVAKLTRKVECYYQDELPLMSHNDGVALLRSVTSLQCGTVINQLVKLCLGLPLAILMTGCELEMDGRFLKPEQMVDVLSTCRLEAWSRDCTYSQQEQLGPVYSNFIRRLTAEFRQRLTVLGYIPGSFTTRYAQHMLGAQSTQVTEDETLSPLMRRHMLESNSFQRRYNIHGILKDCLDVYFSIENLPEVRKRYCKIFSEVMQELSSKLNTREGMEAVTELAREHPNLRKLLLDIAYSSQETYPVYVHMVDSASNVIEQYFGGESFQFYTTCLELCKQYNRPRDDAIVSGAYGRVLTNVKSDLQRGEKMYNRALDFVRADPAAVDMAAQLYQNLGWNLHSQGKKEEALRSLEEAQNYQSLIGPIFLTTLSTLGIVHTAIGNYEEGEKYHMESLRRRIEKYGENHPHIGSVYNNLGILYLQRGDLKKSNYYYRKGLEVKRATKATSAGILISISNVVCVETSAKNFAVAEELLDEALEILRKMPNTGIHTNEEALIHEGYGRLYLAKGQYKDAIRILETAAQRKVTLKFGKACHVESLLSLGRAHKRSGDTSKALEVFYEALSYKEKVAKLMPQNVFIWACLREMVDILAEGRSSVGRNSDDLIKLFSCGHEELTRITSHYEKQGIFTMREKYDKELKAWNERCTVHGHN